MNAAYTAVFGALALFNSIMAIGNIVNHRDWGTYYSAALAALTFAFSIMFASGEWTR